MRSWRAIVVGVTCTLGALTVAVASPAVAAQPPAVDELTNHTRSSTGANLVSRGICGGAFSFDIVSNGFEYLKLGEVHVLAGEDQIVWGEWFEVPQHYSAQYSLPVGYQYNIYTVQGLDSTTAGWEGSPVVTTRFERITNGDNYGTWFC